jgi:hypothetical protein
LPLARSDAQDQLADAISEFYADPMGYVMFNWDWAGDETIQLVKLEEPWRSRYGVEYGPDKWACEFLEDWGREIRKRKFNGRDAVEPIQFSTASGHGIGKSVAVAWIVKFILDTRPYSKGTITANTDVQLRTKTWAALGAWHSKSLTKDWFDYSAGRGSMALRSKIAPQDWFATGQTCREENSESFAGQHAANATSFYVFDEASAVPDKIFEVRKGGLMTGEPMTFDFGNPTRNTGAFYENCVGRQKHRYKVRMIDARDVAITNKREQQKMIDDFGIDSDIVKVRVLGQFPSQSMMQFISTESAEAAADADDLERNPDPIVIGVDVARFGGDESVIYPRQGRDARSWAPKVNDGRYLGLDTVQLTGKVIEKVRFFRSLKLRVARIFVDGGGIGGGVVDQLRHLGYPVTEVNFGGKPTDSKAYRYKVDEMYGEVKEHLGRGLILPRIQGVGSTGYELTQQLTQREFGYTAKQQMNLEPKDKLRERLGVSPDIADGLALTYAQEIAPAGIDDLEGDDDHGRVNTDYDPLEDNFGDE